MAPHISSTIVSDIYKSRTTLCIQLEKRGFNMEQYKNFGISEINTLLKMEQLDMVVGHNENEQKCYIKYYLEKPLKKNQIEEDIERLFNEEKVLKKENNDEIIYITSNDPNDVLKKYLELHYYRTKLFVSVYNFNRLLYNVLDHSMVPKHRVLTAEEKKKVFEKYNILNNSQVAEISRFDPVAVAIGIRPDELCEIERKSINAITSYYYRICV